MSFMPNFFSNYRVKNGLQCLITHPNLVPVHQGAITWLRQCWLRGRREAADGAWMIGCWGCSRILDHHAFWAPLTLTHKRRHLALTHKPSSGFHNIQQGSRSGDHDEGPRLEAFVGSQAGGLTRAGGPPDTGGHQPKV
jgi:hypothetical protein